MEPIILKHPYVAVKDRLGDSYGGSQAWSSRKYMRENGCGLISGMDLLSYLEAKRTGKSEYSVYNSREEYNRRARQMAKRYFPVIPKLGKTGWDLALGVQLYCLIHKLPYTVRFGVFHWQLWKKIQEMLERDIPVVLTIGPPFPFRWKRAGVRFYQKKRDQYIPGPMVQAHFVNVTGMSETWLRISSWGRMYYLRRDDFWSYAKKYGNFLVCNILYVKERRQSPCVGGAAEKNENRCF